MIVLLDLEGAMSVVWGYEIMIMIKYAEISRVFIYRDMAMANAMAEPRIRYILHRTVEAAPVYSAGL